MDIPSRESLPGQTGMEKLEEMIRTYRQPAMALALNILGNREDAEDACQEMFASAFHELDSLPFPAGAKRWLFTILYRKCLDIFRRRRRSVRLAWKVMNENPDRLFYSDDTGGNPDQSRPNFLSKALLAVLSNKEKAVLSLWANEDYSPDEIAQIMGCSASTVRVHLFRARRKIKDKLEKDHDILPAR